MAISNPPRLPQVQPKAEKKAEKKAARAAREEELKSADPARAARLKSTRERRMVEYWTDGVSNVKTRLSRRFRDTVKSHGFWHCSLSEDLLGCTWAELYASLCARLPDEWASYDVLELDHELPIHMFDFSDAEQVRACWHFSNLRWMPAELHEKKGAKLPAWAEPMIGEGMGVVDVALSRRPAAEACLKRIRDAHQG